MLNKIVPAIICLVAFCSSGFAQTPSSGRCASHEKEILRLVNTFEKAQMKGKAETVLDLFTTDGEEEDIKYLAFWKGTDGDPRSHIYPRLYSEGLTNFIQPAFAVLANPQEVDSNCITTVVEWRRYYPHGVGGDFGEGKLYVVNFLTVQVGNSWKIAGYFSPKGLLRKFSGWYDY